MNPILVLPHIREYPGLLKKSFSCYHSLDNDKRLCSSNSSLRVSALHSSPGRQPHQHQVLPRPRHWRSFSRFLVFSSQNQNTKGNPLTFLLKTRRGEKLKLKFMKCIASGPCDQGPPRVPSAGVLAHVPGADEIVVVGALVPARVVQRRVLLLGVSDPPPTVSGADQ